ncbi:glycoside hydrolase family 3 N-terminal domain-containing protein [Aliiglaciecola sp. LCG003]|uniref:glycoside hydrolase family 3 N-terminal domain-containing protein n=1 Tax=Aliiglaciecola sp. LCG003 TaxID=3053655 RepID=UPI0025748CA8|nr:glycoside hydrolase family 3 N-terminal domain-containing protein [Aliiglaciecola sp. LCG003]WJG08657.1 glycoside hydrolase family 3 N-terminal domain-containing protein [Aliiglaciecola sp. LCG003]
MNKQPTRLQTILTTASLLCMAFALPAAANDYQNSALPIEQRVDDLLSRMTLEEKVAQLQTVWNEGKKMADANKVFLPEMAAQILPLGIGHIARPSEGMLPLETVKYTNGIQKWLVEETRLGIPAIFHEEALHGHAATQSTSFPQAIALASMWDADLLYQMYKASSIEVRARGGNQALTPILDVARDPRWGRIEETMGEDTYLITELGVAAIKGFQGDGERIPSSRVLSTLKHLTGHGQPSSGLNIAPAPMGERELREVFLPPFEAAIKLANARSVMASYNEIDGLPSHANKKLLTGILRDEWGFDGVLVSDYYAIKELITRHGLAGTLDNAAKMALDAGVDVEMPDRDAYPLLIELVKSGRISEQQIDVSVARVLADKFRLGLFENAFTDEKGISQINSKAHQALALKTAEKSIVLLKNDGILPLNINQYKKVAVIGPHADETLLGGYSSVPLKTVTILDGIKSKLAGKAQVSFARGALITEDMQNPSAASVAAKSYSKQRWDKENMKLADPKDYVGMLDEAVALAEQSDIAILVVGSNEGSSREAWAENHLGDRSSLTLLGEQQQLVEAVLATGKPTVVILYNGRPLTLGDKINQQAPAIVEAWYLGQETGTALANMLFGDVNPGGKLPVTFPKDIGQLPLFYNHKQSAKRGYIFGDTAPQYPFGHGLSYTQFSYSDLTIDDSKAAINGEVTASFNLKNSGKRAGDEVVQFYVHDLVASATRPVKELKGFKRISLEPNQSVKVTFTLPVNMLAYYDANMDYVLDSGEIQLMIGSSSADIRLQQSFEIKGETQPVLDQHKAFLSEVRVSP